MSEHDEPMERRPLTIADVIEEGGWKKPVAPPKADARPTGLPPRPSQAQPTDNGKSSETGQGNDNA